MNPVLAAAVAAGVALLAWRLGNLTRTGTVAAGLVGTAILIGCGWPGAAVLAAFFISSSGMSRIFRSSPNLLDFKSARRDAAQVAANGGAAALGGLLGLVGGATMGGFWVVTASLAAATADTWATEVGQALGGSPRNLRGGARVAPGTSGAVTWIGTAAGILGAGLVAVVGGWAAGSWPLALWGTALGTAGMALDSVLGATVQGHFECPACHEAWETPVHHCGQRTERQRGWRWVNNDIVNGMSTTAAALGGLLVWWAWASSF